MVEKEIFSLLRKRVFFIVLFLICVPFFFSKTSFASEGYLDYCSGGYNWVNYPYSPPPLNSSRTCLNKRYCSDLKRRRINIDDFDRYKENLGGNIADSIKTVSEVVTTNGECSRNGETREIIKDKSNFEFAKIITKITTGTEDDYRCITTTVSPVVFSGSGVDCQNDTCNDLKDLDGNFILINGNKIKYRPPILFDENAVNCLLKSCLDLNLDEFEAIYETRYKFDSDGTRVPNFKQFCMPYKYTGTVRTGDQNVKYMKGLPNTSSYLDNLLTKERDGDSVYCHEFEDMNYLSYLLREGSAFDEKGNIIDTDSSFDKNKIYHCKFAQCPVMNGLSITCQTNYYLFDKRSPEYIIAYEKNILNNMRDLCVDDSGNQIEDCNFDSEEEYYKVLAKAKENIDEFITKNPKRATNCSRLFCGKIRNTQILSINAGNISNKSKCDEFTGLDKDLIDYKNDGFDYKKASGFLSRQDIKNEDAICYKTVDCALDKYKNDSNSGCIEEKTDSPGSDSTLSYFYRPIPSSVAVEELTVNKNFIDNSEKLTSTIYKNREPFYRSDGRQYKINGDSRLVFYTDSDKVIPVNDKMKIKTIKRELVGALNDITTFNRDEGEYADEKKPFGFGSQKQYSVRKDYLINYFKEDKYKVCADSANEFKKYGYYGSHDIIFWGIIRYWYGEYYSGYGRATKIGTTPHIIPLCNSRNSTGASSGRAYFCGTRGLSCTAPNWTSYYIKGKPTYTWQKNDAAIDTINVTACVRFKSSGELSVCGERECRVDCGAGICSIQWCGIDKCVDLTYKNGGDCSLEGLRENDDWNEYKGKSKSGCVKKVSDAVRLRANQVGRNLLVLLDVRDDHCIWGDKYIEDSRYVRRNRPQRDDGTYQGKLDEYSLLDNNELIDYTGDGIINDNDIFGEKLFKLWNCDAKNEKDKNPNCYKFMINNGNNAIDNEINNWFTWDVVQYIGNNQPQSQENCKVGSIKNCRGYYDNTGNFVKEQQNFIVPLPTSPDFFYKYATRDNSPDLFLPLLSVIAFQDATGTFKNLITTPESQILLDFFNPTVRLLYGETTRDIGVAFNKNEITGNIETKYNNEIIDTSYKLKKISRIYPTPEAELCISQVSTEGNEQNIKCLRRNNPTLSRFVIKPVKVNTKTPYINAYFSRDDVSKMENGKKLDLNNGELFLPFYNNYVGLNSEETKKLFSSAYAYSQSYPIYFENSYCSALYYSCIFNKKELSTCNELLSGEYEGSIANLNCDSSRVADLKNEILKCDSVIEPFCNIMNGSPALVQKTTKNGDTEKNVALRFKQKYDKDGGFNQMCVSKGFENYSYYVKALKMDSAVGGAYLGKCVLDDNSKKKPECRPGGYYAFCSQNNVDGCFCLDGSNNCDCSIEANCVRTISCQCSGDDCLNLPEACFVSGYNAKKNKLNYSEEITDSCDCIFIDENDVSIKGDNTYEIRKATPRELGLCVDLMTTNYCEPLKYYDSEKNYSDGGAGDFIADIINKGYLSNIWRTQQKVYGKYFFGDLGHAEFDKTNDCDSLSDGLKKDFCLSKQYAYNEDTGELCKIGSMDSKCKTVYAHTGVCNGFWKNRENVVPLAKCVSKKDNFTGEQYAMFEPIPNTGCERYSCPSISNRDVILDKEISVGNVSETSVNSIDKRGIFHGFAAWNEYKKGTHNISDDDIVKKKLENNQGDDLEEVNALHCIQGYGPSGLNVVLDKYMPAITNLSDEMDILVREDEIIKNIVGYDLNEPRKIYYKTDAEYQLAKTKYDIKKALYDIYSAGTSYYAKNHLPARYCSQLGNWLGVNDIYSRYKILNDLNSNKKVPLYSVDNPILHNVDINTGFLNSNVITSLGFPSPSENTYGQTVDYGKKFCERLYCQGMGEGYVGLLSLENSNPKNELAYNNTTSDSLNNKYYPNDYSSLNYPRNIENAQDNRVNLVYNNKYTTWRHAGGASWIETPAPRDSMYVRISGKCVENKSFFPYDTTFLNSFDTQYASLFDANSSAEKNLKDYSLKASGSASSQPNRVCSKWGQWSTIKNKCVPTCETLDPFRTDFSDANKNGKIDNYEVNKLYRIPRYRSDYVITASDGKKIGDIYTGGAKWARTKVGNYVVGACDSTVGQNNNISGFPIKGVQFIKSGNKNTKIPGTTIATYGAPYRECLSDGTWGGIKDPCVNITTCSDYSVGFGGLGLLSGNIISDKTIATLLGGSITIQDTSTDVNPFVFTVEDNCNREIFTGGKVYRDCNYSTGDWVGNLTNTCNLKTCSSKNENYGVYNKNVDIPANKYYLKSSGLTGVLSIGSYSYNGYVKEEICPTGYSCENCESSNKVSYTCDFDSDRFPSWIRKGECKIKTCGALNNEPYGIFDKYFNIEAGKYYTKASGLSGKITIGANIYEGNITTTTCPTGYTCIGCVGNKVSYSCDLDGNGNPQWSRQGICQIATCPANNTSYGVYNITISILSGKYYTKTSSLSGQISIPPSTYEGHTKEVSCPNSYSCADCLNNKISYSCDFNLAMTPVWTSRGSCQIKTCGAITNDSYGVYNKYFNAQAGKYYMKNSGENGKITIGSIAYEGHSEELSCPSGYMCSNCVNNKVNYICDAGSTGNPEWVKKGNCQIATCPANNTSYGVYNTTINILNGKYYVKSSGLSGAITIGVNNYDGYEKRVSCPSGYTCSNCNDNKVNYTCDVNSNGLATWTIQGKCQLMTCPAISNDFYGVYNKYFSVLGNKYYAQDSGLSGPITIPPNSYSGYSTEETCPEGYSCNNCTNSKILYSCNADSSGNAVWNRKGSCQIKTCSAKQDILGGQSINIPADKYYTKTTGLSGSIIISSNTYDGYLYSVSCPTNYGCVGCLNNKVSYICDLNSIGNAEWTKQGSCVPQICLIKDLVAKCSSTDGCNSLNISSGSTQCIDYAFTGGQQTFVVPNNTNEVKLEVWGSGGSSGYLSSMDVSKGGYSYGSLKIAPGNVFYIYVGNKDGYNGGGKSGTGQYNSGSGGGATDIRLNGVSLNDRIIVAGGGGGGTMLENGGGGGGGGGNSSGGYGCESSKCCGVGASQSNLDTGRNLCSTSNIQGSLDPKLNGSFGKGGDGGIYNSRIISSGGGGGWYGGGGGGIGLEGSIRIYPGGGGSGYLSSNLSESGGISGNNEGNGKAKICQNNTSGDTIKDLDGNDGYPYYTVVDLECASGYYKTGNISGTCNTNSTWTINNPSSCVRVCDLNLLFSSSGIANSKIDGVSMPSNGECKYDGVYPNCCPEDFELIEGSSEFMCAKVTNVNGAQITEIELPSFEYSNGNLTIGDIDTTGSVYENKYFANNSKINASCEVLYDESQTSVSGGYTPSQKPWSKGGNHYYTCENGNWKPVGSCVPQCTYSSLASLTFDSQSTTGSKSNLLSQGTWYNSAGTTTVTKPTSSTAYYSNNTSYQIACPTGYTTIQKRVLNCRDGEWITITQDKCIKDGCWRATGNSALADSIVSSTIAFSDPMGSIKIAARSQKGTDGGSGGTGASGGRGGPGLEVLKSEYTRTTSSLTFRTSLPGGKGGAGGDGVGGRGNSGEGGKGGGGISIHDNSNNIDILTLGGGGGGGGGSGSGCSTDSGKQGGSATGLEEQITGGDINGQNSTLTSGKGGAGGGGGGGGGGYINGRGGSAGSNYTGGFCGDGNGGHGGNMGGHSFSNQYDVLDSRYISDHTYGAMICWGNSCNDKDYSYSHIDPKGCKSGNITITQHTQ